MMQTHEKPKHFQELVTQRKFVVFAIVMMMITSYLLENADKSVWTTGSDARARINDFLRSAVVMGHLPDIDLSGAEQDFENTLLSGVREILPAQVMAILPFEEGSRLITDPSWTMYYLGQYIINHNDGTTGSWNNSQEIYLQASNAITEILGKPTLLSRLYFASSTSTETFALALNYIPLNDVPSPLTTNIELTAPNIPLTTAGTNSFILTRGAIRHIPQFMHYYEDVIHGMNLERSHRIVVLHYSWEAPEIPDFLSDLANITLQELTLRMEFDENGSHLTANSEYNASFSNGNAEGSGLVNASVSFVIGDRYYHCFLANIVTPSGDRYWQLSRISSYLNGDSWYWLADQQQGGNANDQIVLTEDQAIVVQAGTRFASYLSGFPLETSRQP